MVFMLSRETDGMEPFAKIKESAGQGARKISGQVHFVVGLLCM